MQGGHVPSFGHGSQLVLGILEAGVFFPCHDLFLNRALKFCVPEYLIKRFEM